MQIAAIPLYLLRHSAELVTEYEPDKWGGNGIVQSQCLEHIRIEPCRSVRFSLTSELPEISAKLFYDFRNSRPADNPFRLKGDTDSNGTAERQTVIFMGKKYIVSKIEVFYNGAEPHHAEVLLS